MSLIYSMRLLPNKYGNAPIYWQVGKLLDERRQALDGLRQG